MIASPLLWPHKPEAGEHSYCTAGPHAAWKPNPVAYGKVSTSTSSEPTTLAGYRSASIADTIYNQIHLSPRRVELGLLLSGVETEVLLWNAYRHSVDLYDIQTSGLASGSSLSGFAPGELTPSLEVRGVLSCAGNGPAQQRTIYTLATSVGDLDITITASRILLFPFQPDWSDSVTIDYAFDTIIARNESGGEQRRPLAIRPLRRIRASFWANGVEGQHLRNMICQAKDRVLGVPVWTESLPVASIDETGKMLTLDADLDGFWNLTRLCDLVMLRDGQSGAAVALGITEVNPLQRTVTLAQSLTGITITPGSIRLTPVFPGILEDISPTGHTDTLEVWRMTFGEMSGAQPPLHRVPDLSLQPEVWPYVPNWSRAPVGQIELVRTLRTVRGGVIELGRLRDNAPSKLAQSYLLQQDHMVAFLDIITALRGRWGQLYLHDPRQSFALAEQAMPHETALSIVNNGFLEAFEPSAFPMRIWIHTKQGTLRRRILGAERGNPGHTTIHLDTPPGMLLTPDDRIGREYPVRLDSDTISLRHVTAGVAQCEISFQELLEEGV